jgi:UDP-N-acetylglucosamine--N-acetylmuramyl-(pentapeptide) pyrophosphoryl-undecaprenol N-acetylglucosamine transferase
MKLVIIAGGGTAGHINPGISVAQALQTLSSQIKVEFVGTKLGMESELVPAKSFKIYFIRSSKINNASFFAKIIGLCFLVVGFFESVFLILKHKPSYVLGVGGYASVPMVLASALLGRKTAIWEPNAHPGLANQFLSFFVKTAFLVFQKASKTIRSSQIHVLGMPIRNELETTEFPFEVTSQKLKVLHYGGSQGARTIGKALCSLILSKASWLDECEFVHQTGKIDLNFFSQEYKNASFKVEVVDYIKDMAAVYRWADVVIARAGASTLAELAKAGKPCILIPLPLADGHQIANAKNLAQKKAAVLILQKDLSAETLGKELKELKENVEKRKYLHANIQQFHSPRAAQKIAQQILKELT